MTPRTLTRVLTLAALTGVRSMAGLTTLAARHRMLAPWFLLATAGEMALDKTTVVGNRTDALPLAGRAACGALVGGLVAFQADEDVVAASLLGAVTAVAAAHVAFQWRTQVAPAGVAGGVIEDAAVLAVALTHA